MVADHLDNDWLWEYFAFDASWQVGGGLHRRDGVCVVALQTGIFATAFANQISRRHDSLEAEIVTALKDGIINKVEMQKITTMQDELGMSEEHPKAMIELLRADITLVENN